MTLINFFFFAHQPERLRPLDRRPIGARAPETIERDLFDDELNETIFRKVAGKCYFPATETLLDLAESFARKEKPFRFSFGLSGTFLDQAQRYEPKLITLFQRLAKTGMVEFTGETYYHSLASLWGDERAEFRRQVEQHAVAIERLFGRRPTVFRNTECLYNNEIARTVQGMGFAGIMTEGVDWVLDWRSPDFLYKSMTGLPVLLRNYRYSDDIGYRFPNASWEHYPLTAEKFAGWLAGNTDEIVSIMIDYEALGEHIWAEKGIFEFLRHLPDAILRFPQLAFTTPGEAVTTLRPRGEIDVGPFATISWADMERDTSAWLRNDMQRYCYEALRTIESPMLQANNPDYLRAWRLLQTSDHLYYLCDKSLSDGDVHTYFSAYGDLFESFIRLETAIADLRHAVLNYVDRPGEAARATTRTRSRMRPSAAATASQADEKAAEANGQSPARSRRKAADATGEASAPRRRSRKASERSESGE
jgi:alpha-amylase